MKAEGRIWLIGGTSESAILAKAIEAQQLPCIITVTTEAAKALYPPETDLLQVWVGRLDAGQIPQFLHHYNIRVILDASHPYAVEISKLAIASSTQYQIPYLRYERPLVDPVLREDTAEKIYYLDSFETLLNGDYLTGKRVMLTLGYRQLSPFKPWQEKAVLFVRILPSITSLEAAFKAGFTPDRIIALRPPISQELEKALWQQWDINLVVTKASGVAGGEEIKRQVADDLKIPLIIINRPVVEYPKKTDCSQTAIQFVVVALATS